MKKVYFGGEKISSLDDYSLLVIDDLGVERSIEYVMEQMFTVIDSRYRSKKPLIGNNKTNRDKAYSSKTAESFPFKQLSGTRKQDILGPWKGEEATNMISDGKCRCCPMRPLCLVGSPLC